MSLKSSTDTYSKFSQVSMSKLLYMVSYILIPTAYSTMGLKKTKLDLMQLQIIDMKVSALSLLSVFRLLIP